MDGEGISNFNSKHQNHANLPIMDTDFMDTTHVLSLVELRITYPLTPKIAIADMLFVYAKLYIIPKTCPKTNGLI